MLAQVEFLFRLHVDHRRSTLVPCYLVGPLQRRGEILRGRNVLTVGPEGFAHLVVPHIFLEQMYREANLIAPLA